MTRKKVDWNHLMGKVAEIQKKKNRPKPKITLSTDQIYDKMWDAALNLEPFDMKVSAQDAQTIIYYLDRDSRVQHHSSGGGDVTYFTTIKGRDVLLNVNDRLSVVEVSPQEPDTLN